MATTILEQLMPTEVEIKQDWRRQSDIGTQIGVDTEKENAGKLDQLQKGKERQIRTVGKDAEYYKEFVVGTTYADDTDVDGISINEDSKVLESCQEQRDTCLENVEQDDGLENKLCPGVLDRDELMTHARKRYSRTCRMQLYADRWNHQRYKIKNSVTKGRPYGEYQCSSTHEKSEVMWRLPDKQNQWSRRNASAEKRMRPGLNKKIYGADPPDAFRERNLQTIEKEKSDKDVIPDKDLVEARMDKKDETAKQNPSGTDKQDKTVESKFTGKELRSRIKANGIKRSVYPGSFCAKGRNDQPYDKVTPELEVSKANLTVATLTGKTEVGQCVKTDTQQKVSTTTKGDLEEPMISCQETHHGQSLKNWKQYKDDLEIPNEGKKLKTKLELDSGPQQKKPSEEVSSGRVNLEEVSGLRPGKNTTKDRSYKNKIDRVDEK